MLLEVAGPWEASPRPTPLPTVYHQPAHDQAKIIDTVFKGVRPDEVEHLCAFLLDGDDDVGAPLPASKPSSPQPALSCAVAPPRDQRSPPVAQPQTPFSAVVAAAWPTQVSPFAAPTTLAPAFTAPHSASGGPSSPARTGDRAISWVAMWCARAEAEGIECLPPPSQSSWQELVASGNLSGTLGHSLSLSPPPPAHGATSGLSASCISGGPAATHRCDMGPRSKRHRLEASQQSVRWAVPDCCIPAI